MADNATTTPTVEKTESTPATVSLPASPPESPAPLPSDAFPRSPVRAGPVRTDTTTAMQQSMHPPPMPPPQPFPSRMTRTYSTAIGPSSDSPIMPSRDVEEMGPSLLITLLLTSGARHPFRLDAKYLNKRQVEVQGNDPYNLSIYKLKELILREWREEWETKPSSPSYIRLISFGKLLDDKSPLRDLKISEDSPNVVHMTIKPQDFVEEEDTKASKASFGTHRNSETRTPGCRCIVM